MIDASLDENQMNYLTVEDICRLMKISRPTARKLFDKPDFPALFVGRRMFVREDLFLAWGSQRRVL